MKLTVGPILFHWPAETIADFYRRLAEEAPVEEAAAAFTAAEKKLKDVMTSSQKAIDEQTAAQRTLGRRPHGRQGASRRFARGGVLP